MITKNQIFKSFVLGEQIKKRIYLRLLMNNKDYWGLLQKQFYKQSFTNSPKRFIESKGIIPKSSILKRISKW